ncbi:MAG: hypothetical protein HQL07_10635 [Nitrospirae bacterium]|nr:hypothetical protein [Magnetococcales bacterium]HAT50574.1 hypothetical protein [Alphaproteobacteria bacterium]
MKYRDLLANWGPEKLKLSLGFLDVEFKAKDEDRNAAWDLYVELLTRTTTQHLSPAHGDEKTALDSIYALFGITRTILKSNGPGCVQFSKIAIVVLNQIIRPFTEKWHKNSLSGAFEHADQCLEFRAELKELQTDLRKYTAILAKIANVEDLTDIEGDDK